MSGYERAIIIKSVHIFKKQKKKLKSKIQLYFFYLNFILTLKCRTNFKKFKNKKGLMDE